MGKSYRKGVSYSAVLLPVPDHCQNQWISADYEQQRHISKIFCPLIITCCGSHIKRTVWLIWEQRFRIAWKVGCYDISFLHFKLQQHKCTQRLVTANFKMFLFSFWGNSSLNSNCKTKLSSYMHFTLNIRRRYLWSHEINLKTVQ